MLERIQQLPTALRHSLIYASALALSKAMALVMVPVATHFLTPADYGRLDVLQTLADLLSIIIGMGLAETLFRFAGSADNEQERRAACANIFGLAICLGAFALVAGQILASTIAVWLPGDIAVLEARLILASLSLVGTILVPLSWLRMQGQPWHYFLGSAVRVLLQVLMAVPLLFLGFGVLGVLSATLASALLLSGWLIFRQWRDTGISFEFSRFKAYSFYGGPLIFVGIAGFILGSFDRWILAGAAGTAEMAQYALAAKFGLITAVFIQPFDLWWHPKRFSCLKEENGAARCAHYASIGICVAIFAALIVAAIGPTLVRWLTPETYHASIAFIPWLAALAAIHNINATLSFGLMSQDTTVRPAVIDGIAAAIALLLYWLLIPRYFAWGAIAATSIALSIRLVISYTLSQQALQLPYKTRRLIMLAGIGLGGLSLLPSGPLSFGVVLQSIALLISFVVCSVMLGIVPLPKRSAAFITRVKGL
ncbi:oligosaccharide flippase family protein [Neptunomonas sp. XY-337]|uniref:lipopolysaccharide biosynthesis protein n=1 Tax=Neptunomonas sp. XY-337 TaxID=2561897 RepID=UPI0010A9D629|nr:oligosaccharide flippase family protein [Neptunomonas sp. XY-337]